MTHLRLSALGLFLAVVFCFQTTHAQQTNPPPNERAAAEAALREKAFKLLDSLSDQLSSLQSAENRARIASNIAGSLWSHDEKRARDLFRLVADEIKVGLQQSKQDRDSEQRLAVFMKLREDNLERIAKHDPELALSFIAETFPFVVEAVQDSDGKIPPAIVRHEHELELQLARKIGTNNVEVAVRLARRSLEQGLSDDLLLLLIKLNAKNREQAQLLYKDIVRKIAGDDFSNYDPVVHFATELIKQFTPPAADDATYRELINVLLTKAIAKGCDRAAAENDEEHQDLCAYVGAVVPLMEKFSPAQARRLSRWAPQDRDYIADTRTEGYSELNYVSAYGTIDEMMALRSKYPELDGEILLRGVYRADSEGDLERGRKLASGYTGSDPDVQRELSRRLEFYNMSEARMEEEWAQAQKDFATEPPQRRAELLLSTANFIARIHRKLGLKIVDEASGLVDTFSPGEKQTQLQIYIALNYCLAKDDRGFAIMESLVPRLNELVGAAAKLEGFDTRYLRDGEWNMSSGGSVGNLLTVLANNAGYFAWSDFDRAVSLAAQFDRSEIRMMAQLKLAQGILAGPPKPISGL
jgi:hypothetical protein